MLTVQKNHVVSLDYTLTNNEGAVLDSSKGQELLTYLHGTNTLIPGLENALEGKSEGDDFKVSLPPAEAYGSRNEDLIHQINKGDLAHIPNPRVGMQLKVEADGVPHIFTITDITDEFIVLDGNHPLAGLTLHFEIQVRSIREATPEEISHGHVHGPGGHNH